MSMTTTPHVNFDGQAREALEYYRSICGGEILLATHGQIYGVDDPAHADRIAFGRVDGPSGLCIMGYDVQPTKDYDPGSNPFYIHLHGSDGDEIKAVWDGLAESATTLLADLGPASFAALYGMLTDRYGVTWIFGADTAPGGEAA